MEIAALLLFAGALLINAETPRPRIAALGGRVIARGPAGVTPFFATMWMGEAIAAK